MILIRLAVLEFPGYNRVRTIRSYNDLGGKNSLCRFNFNMLSRMRDSGNVMFLQQLHIRICLYMSSEHVIKTESRANISALFFIVVNKGQIDVVVVWGEDLHAKRKNLLIKLLECLRQ